MTIYTPYFYVIQEISTGMYYAGAKWARDANPNNLMIKDGYTTSSKIIKKLIAINGIESFIIRKLKIFEKAEDAYDYETRFLKKIDAKNHSLFYNGHNNDGGYKGLIYVLDEQNNSVGIKPSEYNRDEYKHLNKSMILAKDKNGNVHRISEDNSMWMSGELVGIMKNVKCHENTRTAASKRWKNVPKTEEHNKKKFRRLKGIEMVL